LLWHIGRIATRSGSSQLLDRVMTLRTVNPPERVGGSRRR
jgi:hypothetical protein